MNESFSLGAVMAPPKVWVFYVYRLFQKKGEDINYLRSFRVVESGHLLAKNAIASSEMEKEILSMISGNKLDYFFKCSKRYSKTCVDEERGKVEFMAEQRLTDEQVKYFKEHRQIGI